MVSSVKLLPNHYETLGLSPVASEREIAGAFARAMSMFGARSLSGAARIGVAFEVLRNPAKRRAYDRSLGLTSGLQPRLSTVTATVRSKSGFMGSAWTGLAEQIAGPPVPPREPDLKARLEQGAEPRIASFIASSLREPASPAISEPAASPVADENRKADADAALERHVAQLLAVRNARDEGAFDGEVRLLEWKRPAVALLGLVAAAGIIGTLAGLWVRGGSDQATQPEAAVTLALPKAQTNPVIAPLPVAQSSQANSERPPQPRTHSKITAPTPQIVAPQQPVDPLGQIAEANHPADIPSDAQIRAAADQLAPQAPVPASVSVSAAPAASASASASMPLPKGTIARTIEKIGYSCGSVDSVASVESAAPGVFKVSCASGQNYQATPVNGRYHFRKLGGR